MFNRHFAFTFPNKLFYVSFKNILLLLLLLIVLNPDTQIAMKTWVYRSQHIRVRLMEYKKSPFNLMRII